MPETDFTLRDFHHAFDAAEASGAFEVLPPIHPGEILREEFMAPHGLSAGDVARALGLPRSRIERIVKEEIGISSDTALRLARFFRTTAQFWFNLQARFEQETLSGRIGAELDRITPLPLPESA